MSGSKDEVMKGSTAMGQLVDGDKTFEQIGLDALVKQALLSARLLRGCAFLSSNQTITSLLLREAYDLERAAGVLK